MPFRTRDFRRADFETLWRIDQACFDPQLAYSRLELAFYMRRPGAFTLVAEAEDGEVSGNGTTQRRILGFIVAEARRVFWPRLGVRAPSPGAQMGLM